MNNVQSNQPCPHCGRFKNRGVSINAVIIKDGKILLIKRGVEPAKGQWAILGGYVEWDESTEECVRREVREEVGLEVKKPKLVGVFSDPSRHPKQVINVCYLVEVNDAEPKAGDDAEEAQWFTLDELPAQLAFDHAKIVQAAKKVANQK